MKIISKKYVIEGINSNVCECDENECVIYFLWVKFECFYGPLLMRKKEKG